MRSISSSRKRSESMSTATWQLGSQPVVPRTVDVGATARELRARVDDHADVLVSAGCRRSRAPSRRRRARARLPSRNAAVVARRRSRTGRRRAFPPCRRSASRSTSAGRSSARWVTSSPTIVTSSPLENTRCAASGSAQMLNSAAGVDVALADRAAHQHDPLDAARAPDSGRATARCSSAVRSGRA